MQIIDNSTKTVVQETDTALLVLVDEKLKRFGVEIIISVGMGGVRYMSVEKKRHTRKGGKRKSKNLLGA